MLSRSRPYPRENRSDRSVGLAGVVKAITGERDRTAVRLVHRPAESDAGRTLASDVETASTFLERARGLMFRRSIPDEYALVFPFDDAGRRSLHMVFVPFPIDALFLVDGGVESVERLDAWTGLAWDRADTVVELPAGAASEVAAGDAVALVDE
jgi:hypothetical protein